MNKIHNKIIKIVMSFALTLGVILGVAGLSCRMRGAIMRSTVRQIQSVIRTAVRREPVCMS